MKKRLLFFIITFLATTATWTQGLYEANLTTKNSIVRVWHDNEVIIYNEETPGSGYFILYAIGASTAKRIDLPDGFSVKDFEILYNEVYFCGEMPAAYLPSASNGVFGSFNIPNTFNGTGAVSYGSLYWYFDYPNYNMAVEKLKRLDLFINNGHIVMAMTGDSYLYGDPTEKRSTVVSAYYRIIGLIPSWDVYALMDKRGSVKYTDIAALNDVVTAVGSSVNGTGLIAKTFYKYDDFPAQPINQYQADSIDCQNPMGKALITHTMHNEAAITQLDYKAFTLLHLMNFSTGTAVPTAPTRTTDLLGYTFASPWDLHEIRFNHATSNINILEYGILPGSSVFETLLWTFHHAFGIIPLAYAEPISSERQVSFDVDIDSRPVSVGETSWSNTLDIHSHILWTTFAPYLIPTPDNCNESTKINQKENNPTIRQIFVDEQPYNLTPEEEIYTPHVTEIDITPKCE